MHKSLASRVIGFSASLLLTLTAFLIFTNPDFFPPGRDAKIATVLVLAILQLVFQSVCFLNVCSEKGIRWNLVVYISTLSIVLIIIVFSIWIMNHLEYYMMCS